MEFINDLRAARKDSSKVFTAIGLGASFRLVAMERTFRPLQADVVARAMRSSLNRLFLLDFEGTLREYTRAGNTSRRLVSTRVDDVADLSADAASLAPPSRSVLQTLVCLSEDTRNTVVVLSGRKPRALEKAFADVPGIGIIAEHGYYHKVPNLTGDEWMCVSQEKTEWKTVAFKLMQEYCRRVQGSFIEYKGSAMAWIYREAHPEFGNMQGSELAGALEDLLQREQIEIIHRPGYVEVKVEGVNKGTAVNQILERLQRIKGAPDFVLCVGDERSDELMFEALVDQMDEVPDQVPLPSDGLGGSLVRHSSSLDSSASTPQLARSTQANSSPKLASSSPKNMGAFPKIGGLPALPALSLPAGGLPALPEKYETDSPPTLPKLSKYASSANIASLTSGLARGGRAVSMGGALNRLGGVQRSEGSSKGRTWFTCTVGRKPSKAHYYLEDVAGVASILRVCMVASLDAMRTQKERNSITMPARLHRPKIATLEELEFVEDGPMTPTPFGAHSDRVGFVECVAEEVEEDRQSFRSSEC